MERANDRNLVSHPAQHALALNAEDTECLERGPGGPVLDADCARRWYDFLWVYNPYAAPFAAPEHFTKVFEADALTVWRNVAKPQAAQASTFLTTLPWTSVRRKSRPWNLYVSRLWSMPSRCSIVACRSLTWTGLSTAL